MKYHGDKPPVSNSDQSPVALVRNPHWLDEVRARLRVKHSSLRTETAYLYWIRRYIHANDWRHPRELDGVAIKPP